MVAGNIFQITHSVIFYQVIFVFLQDALRCLAQLSGSTNICNLFLSVVKRFGLEDTPLEPENLDCQTNEVDTKDKESTDAMEETNNKRFAIFLYPSTRLVLFCCRLSFLQKKSSNYQKISQALSSGI